MCQNYEHRGSNPLCSTGRVRLQVPAILGLGNRLKPPRKPPILRFGDLRKPFYPWIYLKGLDTPSFTTGSSELSEAGSDSSVVDNSRMYGNDPVTPIALSSEETLASVQTNHRFRNCGIAGIFYRLRAFCLAV